MRGQEETVPQRGSKLKRSTGEGAPAKKGKLPGTKKDAPSKKQRAAGAKPRRAGRSGDGASASSFAVVRHVRVLLKLVTIRADFSLVASLFCRRVSLCARMVRIDSAAAFNSVVPDLLSSLTLHPVQVTVSINLQRALSGHI